jgi:Leucine-rich repeat (LRR) protein
MVITKMIDLSFNRIFSVDLLSLTLMPSLTSLDLSHNKLTDFNESVQNSMPNLQILALGFNRLAVFPVKNGCLSYLKSLDITGNICDNVPACFMTDPSRVLYTEWKVLKDDLNQFYIISKLSLRRKHKRHKQIKVKNNSQRASRAASIKRISIPTNARQQHLKRPIIQESA